MMAPRVTGEPTLVGDRITLRGYSLGVTDPTTDLEVKDLGRGRSLRFDPPRSAGPTISRPPPRIQVG